MTNGSGRARGEHGCAHRQAPVLERIERAAAAESGGPGAASVDNAGGRLGGDAIGHHDGHRLTNGVGAYAADGDRIVLGLVQVRVVQECGAAIRAAAMLAVASAEVCL